MILVLENDDAVAVLTVPQTLRSRGLEELCLMITRITQIYSLLRSSKVLTFSPNDDSLVLCSRESKSCFCLFWHNKLHDTPAVSSGALFTYMTQTKEMNFQNVS